MKMPTISVKWLQHFLNIKHNTHTCSFNGNLTDASL